MSTSMCDEHYWSKSQFMPEYLSNEGGEHLPIDLRTVDVAIGQYHPGKRFLSLIGIKYDWPSRNGMWSIGNDIPLGAPHVSAHRSQSFRGISKDVHTYSSAQSAVCRVHITNNFIRTNLFNSLHCLLVYSYTSLCYDLLCCAMDSSTSPG